MSREFEDDGRTVADMSELSFHTSLGFHRSKKREQPEGSNKPDRPWEDRSINRDERKGAVWGALSAAMLIALAFIVGLGLAILIMTLVF